MMVRRALLLCFVVAALAPAASLRADTALGPGVPLTEAAPVAAARFGAAIATGDVNGDGVDDVAISATGPGAGSGEIRIRLGPSLTPGAVITNPDGASSFGTSLAMGDINNDGFDDIIAGALGATVSGQLGAGEAWVFYGPAFSASTVLRDPVPQAAAAFGVSVGAGDTNNDGYDEVIVGAWDSNIPPFVKSGQAFVFSGPSLTTVRTLQSPAPQNIGDFGVATDIGDFDGDGIGDAIVGSWISDVQPGDDAGQVFVLRGPAFTDLITLRDAASGGRLGQSVTSADIDGDAADEIVAGARGGAVVFDAAGASYTSRRIPLPAAWSATTTTVAAADVTGDGLADIAIGAPNAAPAGIVTGAALFLPASPAGLRYTFAGSSPESGARFGAAVALVGGELLAGTPYADVTSLADAGSVFRIAIVDTDHDGALDIDDNCPSVSNTDQANSDGESRPVPGHSFFDATSPDADAAGDACDADDDNDGRSDTDEGAGAACGAFTTPTDPLWLDTDGDYVTDAAECSLGYDPASAASAPSPAVCAAAAPGDSDGDGLPASRELCRYGTSDTSADTDGDGCSDARELASVNADRTVNAIDLSQVAQAFGSASSPAYVVGFDFTRDGVINAIDLSQIAQRFGACV